MKRICCDRHVEFAGLNAEAADSAGNIQGNFEKVIECVEQCEP